MATCMMLSLISSGRSKWVVSAWMSAISMKVS